MLLNENRNRIPMVAGIPVSGTTAGNRGDLIMGEEGSPVLLYAYVCLRSGPAGPGSTSLWSFVALTEI